jgi:hypothetical protein
LPTSPCDNLGGVIRAFGQFRASQSSGTNGFTTDIIEAIDAPPFDLDQIPAIRLAGQSNIAANRGTSGIDLNSAKSLFHG